MPKKVHVTNSLYQLLYPDNSGQEAEEDTEDDEVYMKNVLVNGTQQLVSEIHNFIRAWNMKNAHSVTWR